MVGLPGQLSLVLQSLNDGIGGAEARHSRWSTAIHCGLQECLANLDFGGSVVHSTSEKKKPVDTAASKGLRNG